MLLRILDQFPERTVAIGGFGKAGPAPLHCLLDHGAPHFFFLAAFRDQRLDGFDNEIERFLPPVVLFLGRRL